MFESLLGLEALWLLLPVAAGTGWLAARGATRQTSRKRETGGLRSDYFQGINYLLNEQPDKAIEVFIKLIEVDSETVETHLALGNLYRRRGDVDRAIRIHQNLIARESLNVSQRTEALLELGQDYMSAGLLDRAEDLFSELAEDAGYRVQALRQLIDIYEQEKDWPKAIASARKLEKATGNQLGWIIAHYCCEQASRHCGDGEHDRALKHVHQARNVHAAWRAGKPDRGRHPCRTGRARAGDHLASAGGGAGPGLPAGDGGPARPVVSGPRSDRRARRIPLEADAALRLDQRDPDARGHQARVPRAARSDSVHHRAAAPACVGARARPPARSRDRGPARFRRDGRASRDSQGTDRGAAVRAAGLQVQALRISRQVAALAVSELQALDIDPGPSRGSKESDAGFGPVHEPAAPGSSLRSTSRRRTKRSRWPGESIRRAAGSRSEWSCSTRPVRPSWRACAGSDSTSSSISSGTTSRPSSRAHVGPPPRTEYG